MTSRRAVLGTMIAAPLLTLATRGDARDYASAAEVLSEIDRLEAELDQRLSRLAATFSAAAAFAGSVCADHERHRRTRAALRGRLRVRETTPLPVPAGGASVDALRRIAQDLVYAHAEGLPALRDAQAVDTLARQ
ncbi:MAG: hypothetical protein DMF77_24775, partial [Acidobacteria bacterium]